MTGLSILAAISAGSVNSSVSAFPMMTGQPSRLQQIERAARIGTHRGDIAETNDPVGRVLLDRGQHRFQRHPVAMDIRNKCNAHQAVSIVLRGISTPGTSIPTAAAPSIRIG